VAERSFVPENWGQMLRDPSGLGSVARNMSPLLVHEASPWEQSDGERHPRPLLSSSFVSFLLRLGQRPACISDSIIRIPISIVDHCEATPDGGSKLTGPEFAVPIKYAGPAEEQTAVAIDGYISLARRSGAGSIWHHRKG
jgi:hypothetical protein